MLKRNPLSLATGIALGLASISILWGSTVFAQDQQQATDEDETTLEEVIVTGSIIKRPETATASPVSVVTDQEMDIRGINTIAEAVLAMPANNAGTMNASWSSFGFTPGASAISMRGLTTSSTLTIFDGMRMAPYPLSDDGRRNFVDVGTLPDSIVERIEVLKDGASSTYGADAVAGVVNVITKKEITGMHFNGSYGVSQEGDGDEYRGDFVMGFGELDDEGFNVYFNLELQTQKEIAAGDRGSPSKPFGNWDWTNVCNESGGCLENTNPMGRQADGSFYGVTWSMAPFFYRADPETGARLDGEMGNYQLFDPNGTCQSNGGNDYDITYNPTNAADRGLTGPACEIPYYSEMVKVLPNIDRQGFNTRYTQRLGDSHEFYAMFNYYRVKTKNSGGTPYIFGGTTTPGGPEIERVTLNAMLPIYVCPLGAGGYETCDETNGVLNPNNPFAAEGYLARPVLRLPFPRQSNTDAESFRYAAGITGTFGADDMWDYAVDLVSSTVKLDVVRTGYPIPRRVLNVIYDGSFNFQNPSMNSQDMWDYVAPPVATANKSQVQQVQATVARPLFELPGGSMVAAVGLSYREEMLRAPTANGYKQDPYERYLSVNAVAAEGERDVTSAFFELDMPITDMFLLNLAGRYDDYSTGQDNFSPKVGLQINATDWMRLRGTYSEGFRIPSFNEAFGEPTTGYISHAIDCNASWGAAFCAAHEGTAYASGTYSVGLTASGNPELDPEESKSYTAGIVLEPTNDLSLTIDYWRIKVKNLISGADYSPVLTQYYANNGQVNVPGVDGVVPAAPNPERPNALPLIGFIQYSYQNANSQIAEGIDLGAAFGRAFGAVNYSSRLEIAYLMELSKTINDTKFNYEGTLSPCDVTSCSGAPDWRATWVNSIDWNDWTFALTMNYVGSYDNASTDYGGVPGDCENNIFASVYPYDDGTPYKCTHGSYWDFDFSTSWQINEKFQLYANILNVFDQSPEFDPASAYHLYGFNPSWELNGWRGRYFRLGVRVDF